VNTIGCAAACCPAPGCGNNVKEGSEQCDGTDDAACPGNCHADCTCPACPTTGGDATACLRWAFLPACGACWVANKPLGDLICPDADNTPPGQCLNASQNDACAADLNAIGCGGLCCPPPGCGNNVVEGSEQCDGTDPNGQCPGTCRADCTCPPFTCGGTAPACGGSCPDGGSCVDTSPFGGCQCVGDLSCGPDPTCSDVCFPGYACGHIGPLNYCCLVP